MGSPNSKVLMAAVIVGLAGGIVIILQDGGIIDTILYGLSKSMHNAGQIVPVKGDEIGMRRVFTAVHDGGIGHIFIKISEVHIFCPSVPSVFHVRRDAGQKGSIGYI